MESCTLGDMGEKSKDIIQWNSCRGQDITILEIGGQGRDSRDRIKCGDRLRCVCLHLWVERQWEGRHGRPSGIRDWRKIDDGDGILPWHLTILLDLGPFEVGESANGRISKNVTLGSGSQLSEK